MIQIRRSALVNYSPTQMFDLVSDVEAYPSRFPWCSGVAVLERNDAGATVRLDLHWAGLRHNFTTRNTHTRPGLIRVELVEGPFRSLSGNWTFTALGEHGCKIALELDFEYAGRLVAPALRFGFQKLADRMVDDFCQVARRLYE